MVKGVHWPGLHLLQNDVIYNIRLIVCSYIIKSAYQQYLFTIYHTLYPKISKMISQIQQEMLFEAVSMTLSYIYQWYDSIHHIFAYR